ncbi:hypothetical protein EI94DRAFT_841135 [Lactarius quietus]|nr:hypothetical protein EI94DRAFT_841135 [Lactarius quietus]
MPKALHTVDANYARTVASVLLAFLGALPESLIPPSLHLCLMCCTSCPPCVFQLLTLSFFPLHSICFCGCGLYGH